MSPTTAMYVLERAQRRWSTTDRELADAECVLSDMLEGIRSIRRDRQRIHHPIDASCPAYPYEGDPLTS